MALVKKRRDHILDILSKAEATGIHLSEATREAVQDSLETRSFKLATGIEAERLLDTLSKTEAAGFQLSDATREVTQESLETRLFKLATGIKAEGRTRDELLAVKRSLPASIDWSEVKHAFPYMDTARKEVDVPLLGWLAALGELLTSLLFALLAFHYLTLLPTAVGTDGIGASKLIAALLLSFLLLAGAGIFWKKCWPVWTARKIGKHLELTRHSSRTFS